MKNDLQGNHQFKNYNLALKDQVEVFTKKMFYSLFDVRVMLKNYEVLKNSFLEITHELRVKNNTSLWDSFESNFETIRCKLNLDAQAIEANDPAAKNLEEVYLAYPGLHAIAVYRLSHELYQLEIPILPRMMSEYVHGLTGVDIHPGAVIGNSFFIDHATGIVIGETTIIKNNVKIYQGVTLGGLQVKKNLSFTKRHPTIEDNVTIYANATILGGNVIIGANTIIGANVCVTNSIPENSVLTYQKEYKLSERK